MSCLGCSGADIESIRFLLFDSKYNLIQSLIDTPAITRVTNNTSNHSIPNKDAILDRSFTNEYFSLVVNVLLDVNQ